MSALKTNLTGAVSLAISFATLSDDEATHLSAQRRIDENGTESWRVVIGDFFVRDMTHITDTLPPKFPSGDVEGIAALIAGCWDPACDEIPDGRGGYVTRVVAEAAAA